MASGGQLGLLLAQLLDLGLLAAELAQVVELGAAHVTAGHDLDPVDARAVDRVGPLDADAEADLADREGLAQAGALAADHDALEDLDAGTVALDDPGVHLDGVTGAEVGKVGPLRLGVERVQRVHRCILVSSRRTGSSVREWVILIPGRQQPRSDPRTPTTARSATATPLLCHIGRRDRKSGLRPAPPGPACRAIAGSSAASRSGRRSAVRSSAWSRRQRAIRPWSPERSTSGTSRPRHDGRLGVDRRLQQPVPRATPRPASRRCRAPRAAAG